MTFIAQGFKDEAIPTVEVFVRARQGTPRCNSDSNIIALISEETFEARVPRFDPDNTDELSQFLAQRLGFARPPSPPA